MAEAEKDKLENKDVDTNQDDKSKNVEEKPNMNEDGTNAGPSEGFLSNLKDKFWPKKEEAKEEDVETGGNADDKADDISKEDVVVEDVKGTSEEKPVETKISEDFVEAARRANWTDNQIIEFSEGYTNVELDAMINDLGGSSEPAKSDLVDKDQDKKVADALNISEETLTELKETNPVLVEKVLQPLITKNKNLEENLNTLKTGLGVVQKDKVHNEAVTRENAANKVFDKVAEQFPVFGKTKELARFPDGRIVPQGLAFEARNEVWQAAIKLFRGSNSKTYAFSNALDEAMDMYKGRHLKDDIEQDVVKRIKKKQENLTPKKSRKNVVKTYASEDEKKAAIVRKAAEDAGVTLNS